MSILISFKGTFEEEFYHRIDFTTIRKVKWKIRLNQSTKILFQHLPPTNLF